MPADMSKKRIAVRTLVECVMLRGSIGTAADAQRLIEGAEGHRALQSVELEGVSNEVSVSTDVCSEHIRLTVHGRIDRLHAPDVVEEIKTTVLPVSAFSAPDPQHLAQAMCYAHMLCLRDGLPAAGVTITYFNMQTGELREFKEHFRAEEFASFFFGLTDAYLSMLERAYIHSAEVFEEAEALSFPFEQYRPGQRGLAAACYRTVRDDGTLLVQAPTGIGKSISVLFSALKALRFGGAEKLFWLSARTTGQEAALYALGLLKTKSLRACVITAKEKACVLDTPACYAEACPRADGYYDRVGAALAEAESYGGLFSRERIAGLAEKYTLCPYELSLDISLLCDLIICDYNYVFDPRVKLRRYFSGTKTPCALLIDEAHNLPGRARDMFSAVLDSRDAEAARKAVPKELRKTALYKSLRELKAALLSLEKGTSAEPPSSLYAAIEQAAACTLSDSVLSTNAALRSLSLGLSSFINAASMYDDSYVTITDGAKTYRTVTLFCADASGKLAASYKKCRSAVLFSATLSPASFYKKLCGLPEECAYISLPSPFPPENLLVMNYRLSTRYRDRADTLPAAVQAAAALITSRTDGNFLVYLPSHAYLADFAPMLAEALPQAQIAIQARRMDDSERADFLSRFSPDPCGLTIGLAVMGGIFAEGIDLPSDRLCGAVIIGVGLPQLCAELDVLRGMFEERYGSGYAFAYQYPGAARVMQAAGRIIRSEHDRGVLLLLDDRYTSSAYSGVFPDTWQMLRAQSAQHINSLCRSFWHG